MQLFDPSKTPILSAYEIGQRQVDEDAFLVKPRILMKGGKWLIAGDTEAGKSWICLNIIRALALGEPLFGNPDWPTVKSKTLYIDPEVGITMPERIRLVMGSELTSDIPFYGMLKPEGFSLSLPQCTDWLKSEIKKQKFDVIVLDSIAYLASLEENSNSDVSRFLTTVNNLQNEDTACIFTHHTGKKPRGRDAEDFDPLDIDNIRGASSYKGSADTILMVQREPGSIRVSEDEDNWVLRARWGKTRHARKKPPEGRLFFNENSDGRVVWKPRMESQAPTRKVNVF